MYHSIKKEMKNILTAKANVDHLLGENISEKEKYKKQRESCLWSFSSHMERSHTIYCVFNGDWGYSPTSRFGKNPVREFYAKSQGVYHLALLATLLYLWCQYKWKYHLLYNWGKEKRCKNIPVATFLDPYSIVVWTFICPLFRLS